MTSWKRTATYIQFREKAVSWLKKNKDLIMEENLKKIEEHIAGIYEIADICGLEQNEIIKMFILYGEER